MLLMAIPSGHLPCIVHREEVRKGLGMRACEWDEFTIFYYLQSNVLGILVAPQMSALASMSTL